MDGATIQAKVYAGYGKAAQRVGFDYDLYRPAGADKPLVAPVATIKASFTQALKYTRPNEYGDPTWHVLSDGRQMQVGDYLLRAGAETHFVAAMQKLLPILCVECNRSIKITRQQAQTAVGAIGYGGSVPSQEVDVLGAPGAFWPASILFGGKRQQGVGLPAGVQNVGWLILLPPSVPITIKSSDIVTDDLGRRYAVVGAELTDLGWRLNTHEVHS